MAGDKEQEAAYRTADLMLFESGRFADVLVTCGPRSWNLHKNILCTRSVWFEKALTGSYVAAQMRSQQEVFDAVIRIEEQDHDAVDLCLRYIYGGVAAIDMERETSSRPTFKFCAELYRSADFFLLKPLLPVVQRHLGDYCDEKTRWMWTRGNINEDAENEKEALVWVEDLKDAILETHTWNTPVIKYLLMEFVWASRDLLRSGFPIHISIHGWLWNNVRGFWDDMEDHCDDTPPSIWGRKWRKWSPPPVWTPAPCQTPIPLRWCDTCVRCGGQLEKPSDGYDENAYGQLRDPFNASYRGCSQPREWCLECAAQVKYPWREDGYL